MTNEEIKIFVDKLVTETKKEDAIFGIHQYGGGSDESYVKANKAGLQMFASEILQASITEDNKTKNIPLDYNAEWIVEDSETFLQYVEPIAGTRKKPLPPASQSYWKREAKLYSLAFVFLIIVVCIVTGIVTIVKTIF